MLLLVFFPSLGQTERRLQSLFDTSVCRIKWFEMLSQVCENSSAYVQLLPQFDVSLVCASSMYLGVIRSAVERDNSEHDDDERKGPQET